MPRATMHTMPQPTPWFQLPHAPAPGTPVAALAALADGQATLFEIPAPSIPPSPFPDNQPDPHTDPRAVFKLLVLRNGTQVHAFANRCAHFGVPLAAQQSQLISTPLKSLTCNVHYARYDWASGACQAGECDGEALSPVPLALDADGQLRIGSLPVQV